MYVNTAARPHAGFDPRRVMGKAMTLPPDAQRAYDDGWRRLHARLEADGELWRIAAPINASAPGAHLTAAQRLVLYEAGRTIRPKPSATANKTQDRTRDRIAQMNATARRIRAAKEG